MEPKKKKWKTWQKVLLGCVIAFFGLMAIAVNSKSPNDPSPTEAAVSESPTVSVIDVTAKDLFAKYKANEVSADDAFKGKTLDVSGTVESINKDFTNSIYINLKVSEFETVHCDMSDGMKSAASQLSKGQKVILEGEGAGFVVMSPIVKDCIIK